MKKIIIRHVFSDLGNYFPTLFFHNLYDKLKSKYNEYDFEIITEPQFEQNGMGSAYSALNFSIINPENNKYILISFFDNWRYHFMKHMGWNPNKMVQFFYPAGLNYFEYFCFRNSQMGNDDVFCPKNIDEVYQSFYYPTYRECDEDYLSQLYAARNTQIAIKQLYFCGKIWDFRLEMTKHISDQTIYIANKDSIHFEYDDYLNTLIHYRCLLSLPGGTEICNRDIECFSVGAPVIRPVLNIQYENPLIPNYHYISCYDSCKYFDGYPTYISYKDFALSLEATWNRVKDDIDYLNFIGNNARQWYLKNCTMNNNVNYVLSKIDMELLNG